MKDFNFIMCLAWFFLGFVFFIFSFVENSIMWFLAFMLCFVMARTFVLENKIDGLKRKRQKRKQKKR